MFLIVVLFCLFFKCFLLFGVIVFFFNVCFFLSGFGLKLSVVLFYCVVFVF